MAMSSESSRFQHLLQPIRDLSKNWSIDLAQELEEYLDELESLSIAFDPTAASTASSANATQLMNFAEAALLIQGTSMIYSRKVEYLYALVFQTLSHLSKQQSGPVDDSQDDGETGSGAEDTGTEGGAGRKRRRAKTTTNGSTDVWANPLPIYDDVEEAKNITLKRMPVVSTSASVNATPWKGGISTPRKSVETVKSKNNVQASIALMGSLVPDERDHGETFKLLSCHLHPSGVLLMDDASRKYLKDETAYVAETPAATATKRLQQTPMAKLNFDGHLNTSIGGYDDHDDDHNEPMDDDHGYDYGGGDGYDDANELPAHEETTEGVFGGPMVKPEPYDDGATSSKRKVMKTTTRAAAADVKDPWAALDPYDASKSTVRPFRKGRSYPVKSAKKLLANKLKQEAKDETDGVDDPAFKERYLLSANRPQWSTWVWNDLDETAFEKKFKKKYCKAPCLLTSCESLWKLETKWKSLVRKSAAAEAQSAQAILIHEEAEEEEEQQLHAMAAGRVNDVFVSDPTHNADGGDNDNDDDDDDDLDQGMDYGGGDDDWDTHNASAMSMLDATMVLKNGGFGPAASRDQDRGERALTYEEICRQHLEEFMKGTEKYIRETDLTRQVSDWQDKLSPLLKEQDSHPVFDIHRYGREIIDHLEASGGGGAAQKKKKKTKRRKNDEEEKEDQDEDAREPVPFNEVVDGLSSYEVCRMFLASLQLANNGNVQLLHGKTAADQTQVPFEMQLLSSSNVFESLQV